MVAAAARAKRKQKPNPAGSATVVVRWREGRERLKNRPLQDSVAALGGMALVPVPNQA